MPNTWRKYSARRSWTLPEGIYPSAGLYSVAVPEQGGRVGMSEGLIFA